MVAELVDRFFSTPTAGLLAEIRLNEERLGATAVDRQRLHWKFSSAAEGAEGPARRPRRDPRLAMIKGGKPT